MCGCADKHNFGFLRVKLKKIDELPVINGICALTQIVKLFGDTGWRGRSKGSCRPRIGEKTRRSS